MLKVKVFVTVAADAEEAKSEMKIEMKEIAANVAKSVR
jgi:hypothetical protein